MSRLGRRLDRLAASHLFKAGFSTLAHAHLARPDKRDLPQIHIYYFENRISWAQIHPFLVYRDTILKRFGVALRFLPVSRYLAGVPPEEGAAHILMQTWIDVDGHDLSSFLRRLAAASPAASIDYVDPAATNDLRFAWAVNPHIRRYWRKSLFRDRIAHLSPWRGDTNLMHYASQRFGPMVGIKDRGVPNGILPKLGLSPNFFTSPPFFDAFLDSTAPPEMGKRPNDVHARMDIPGGARAILRRAAFERMADVPGKHVLSNAGVDWTTYMKEMRDSKLCLSPFGFGEICWRDIEAVLTGTVLIKPSMSHLDTLPDLYEDGETYLACDWDFANLPEVIAHALGDAELRRHLTETAWHRLHRYLADGRFIDDTALIWKQAQV